MSVVAKDSTLDVRPLSGAVGAEVWGVDIASLDEAGYAKVHELLLRHSAIALHGQQHATDAQLRAFGQHWGKLDVHGYTPTVEGFDDVLRIRSDPEHPFVAEGWHSDITWKVIPPKISMLLARQTPSVGGDTLFASQYKAYEDLSETMKSFLDSLDAEHDGRVFDAKEADRPVTHPVVLTHPETGRKALYVNRPFTQRIVGLKPQESTALLNFLYRHCSRERYQARVRYETGTLSMWDNRCVQPLAVWDYRPEVRHGYRVAICGDRPV